MIKICPNCNQRYAINDYDTDYEHQCNVASTAVTQEDVLIVGNYVDESTGNTVAKPKLEAMMQGLPNKLYGTRASIEGRDVGDFTERGVRGDNKRQRQHYEHIGA